MRELDLNPFYVKVVFSADENEWIEFCDKFGIKDRTWIEEDTAADVAGFGSYISVRFSDLTNEPHYKIAGIAAHESAHVFQELCRAVGESQPSHEFMAYYIQRVTEWLLKEYECYQSQESGFELEPQPSSVLSLVSTSTETTE